MDELTADPFPLLRWDTYFWTCELRLPSWAGFQSRRGPYGSRSSEGSSDGSGRLYLVPEDADRRTAPTTEQAGAFRYLLEHERKIAAAVLESVFSEYPRLKDDCCYSDEVAAELMPDLSSSEGLRKLIGLSNVHILKVAGAGQAYVGFEFGCTWDEEHGLGVMTHMDRVVEVGAADTAIMEWIAECDAKVGR